MINRRHFYRKWTIRYIRDILELSKPFSGSKFPIPYCVEVRHLVKSHYRLPLLKRAKLQSVVVYIGLKIFFSTINCYNQAPHNELQIVEWLADIFVHHKQSTLVENLKEFHWINTRKISLAFCTAQKCDYYAKFQAVSSAKNYHCHKRNFLI